MRVYQPEPLSEVLTTSSEGVVALARVGQTLPWRPWLQMASASSLKIASSR
jgi:hypothetical protein